MTEKSVIIIGAGLAGLSAGCFARMNGYQSRIFEHHSKPGGVAAAWRRGKYLVDGGIHFLMGSEPRGALAGLYEQLGTARPGTVLKMESYGRFSDEQSGRSLVITADLEALARDLGKLFPGNDKVIDILVRGARDMQGIDMGMMGLARPPELAGSLDSLRAIWRMRGLLKYFTGTYGQPVSRLASRTKDRCLRDLLNNLFLPEVPVYFVTMLLALLADGKLGILRGGCLDFVMPMEERYGKLGGEVSYNATVEKILVENDRAVGIRVADGAEHRADHVISAADGHSTIFRLLEGRYADGAVKSRYRDWRMVRPTVTISYGITRTFPEEPHFHMVMAKEPLDVGGRPQRAISLRILNYGDRFSPPGRTLVQAMLETEWDFWNGLQGADRAAYDAEKERLAKQTLDRLEVHYPGISAQVEMTDVATPFTTWRYTLNHQGAWGGWLITPRTITKAIRATLPGLRNFYMAGQWVQSGGSVPGCLYSGRNAIELICRRDRKEFNAGTV